MPYPTVAKGEETALVATTNLLSNSSWVCPPARKSPRLGGRASWRATAPASPMRLGGSLALPNLPRRIQLETKVGLAYDSRHGRAIRPLLAQGWLFLRKNLWRQECPWMTYASIPSVLCRWMPFSKPIQDILAHRWLWHPWCTACGSDFFALTRTTRSGQTGIALCFPSATPPCFCIPCCTCVGLRP